MTQAERIIKARMGVILSAPFFGSLLMRLRMERDDSKPTFCTDGRVIKYNEAFSASLSDAELRGVLVHEVAHCAQGHMWRMGQRDPQQWNVAADYAINNFLDTYIQEEQAIFTQKNGGRGYSVPWELPKGGLIDHTLDNLSSEEIYAKLPPPQPGQDQPSCGEFEQSSGEGKGEPDDLKLEDEWKIAVTQAATVAKMRGNLPESIKRMIGDLLEPKVPWRDVLREFIRRLARDDYSWRKPNRRYAHQGVVLPSLYSERMGRICIAVDTSGSITDHTLAEFQAEIQAALDECHPESIEVIYCDAAINDIEEFQPGDTVRLTPKGGGGTDFCPVFEHINAADEPPVAAIYLTDGHGSFPDAEPDYPVLWATTDSSNFPFGQVVAVK